jgi:hypothetical protein
MKPEVWGPSLWTLLHSIVEQITSINNTTQVSEKLYNLFEFHFEKIIPCSDCKAGYLKFKTANPIHNWRYMNVIDAKNNAKTWLWNLHETVNRRLNKPSIPMNNLESVYGKQYIPWLLDGFSNVIQSVVGSGLATEDPEKTVDARDLQQFKGVIRSLESYNATTSASILHL